MDTRHAVKTTGWGALLLLVLSLVSAVALAVGFLAELAQSRLGGAVGLIVTVLVLVSLGWRFQVQWQRACTSTSPRAAST